MFVIIFFWTKMFVSIKGSRMPLRARIGLQSYDTQRDANSVDLWIQL